MEAFRFWFFAVLVKLIIVIDELKVLFITIFGIPLTLFVVSAAFPLFQANASLHICRICGATKTETVIHYFDVPVSSKEEIRHRPTVKHCYDLLLADEHEHEWRGGYEIHKSGTLRGWNSVSRSMWTYGNDPMYQPRITHIALSMAVYLRYSPKPFRQELFAEMINSVSKDRYDNLCFQYNKDESRNSRSARTVWRNWLEERQQSGDELSTARADVPRWAYRSVDSIPAEHDDLTREDPTAPSDFSRAWIVDSSESATD